MKHTSWIWLPDELKPGHEGPIVALFRKEVEFQVLPSRLPIRISADTRHKLYINGTLAAFGPAKGNLTDWYYDTVDAAAYLHPGKNVFAVEVLRYPLGIREGNQSLFRTQMPGLYIAGEGLSADESWKCRISPRKLGPERRGFSPLYYMEEALGEESLQGWMHPGYSDRDWANAREYTFYEINRSIAPANLSPRPIPQMYQTPGRFPVTGQDGVLDRMLQEEEILVIPAHTKRIITLSNTALTCAFLKLKLSGGKGSRITLLYAEGYVQKDTLLGGRYPKKGDRTDSKDGILKGYTDSYLVGGYGTAAQPEEYEPYWFRTFRCLQLEIDTEEELAFRDLSFRETGYPLEISSWAETSDPEKREIWDISLRTLLRCMHETYQDCPYYEQLQYAMDARSEILFTYSLSRDDQLARACIESFRASQRSDGLMNSCSPSVYSNIIPTFSIYFILMVYDHMMYFGDLAFVRRQLSAVDAILEFFNNNLEERGLVRSIGGPIGTKFWSFIDWAEQWDASTGVPTAGLGGRPITMESFLYLTGLMGAAELCRYAGRLDTAKEYDTRGEALRQAIRTHCRDNQGSYLDGPGVNEYSQHCQVFAVLTETASPEEGRLLLQRSLSQPEKYAACTVAMRYYLFRAMEKTQLYAQTQPLWDPWRRMLIKHLTTCVENETNERSDCHAWGSVLLYELPSVILGVRPGAPGYQTIVIAPHPDGTQYARGEVITKWGPVRVEWEQAEDGKLSVRTVLPDLPPQVKVLKQGF